MDLPRRSFLLLGTGLVVSGCASSTPRTSSPAASPTPTPSASTSPSPTEAALPSVPTWHPSGNDRQPACKQAAVRHVVRAGTTKDQVVEVVDAQYGGLLRSSASVLVVTRSFRRAGTRVVAGGRTYDVRLVLRGSAWTVTDVYPSLPGPRAGTVSALARKVLRDERIDLPPAARRDVESGQVHDSVLGAMTTLASSYRIGISVLRSGHPLYVFGTTRRSDHPQGRAFDTWRIDGRAVVDARTPRSLVTEYMHAAAAAGSYNVGGPYLLGGAPQWFSDDTHHDHVHAGFTA